MTVIITGSSSAFSAGFDLSDFNHPEQFDRLLHSSSRYQFEAPLSLNMMKLFGSYCSPKQKKDLK